jgi:Flp pilus assembly protein TadG
MLGRTGEEKGQVMIMAALLMVVILGLAAIVIDVGRIVVEKQRIQNAADAAALAGAYELPDSTSQARAKALEYNGKNGVSSGETRSITFTNSNKEITVTNQRTVGLTFAKVLGFRSKTVTASAKATGMGMYCPPDGIEYWDHLTDIVWGPAGYTLQWASLARRESSASGWELGLGPNYSSPATTADFTFTKGANHPFVLTWDGTDDATFSVGGGASAKSLAWNGKRVVTDAFIRAQKGSGTLAESNNMVFNGVPIPTASAPYMGHDVDIVRVHFCGAFTLTGNVRLNWSSTSAEPTVYYKIATTTDMLVPELVD